MNDAFAAHLVLADETGVGVLLRVPRPLCGLLLYLRRTPTPVSSERLHVSK